MASTTSSPAGGGDGTPAPETAPRAAAPSRPRDEPRAPGGRRAQRDRRGRDGPPAPGRPAGAHRRAQHRPQRRRATQNGADGGRATAGDGRRGASRAPPPGAARRRRPRRRQRQRRSAATVPGSPYGRIVRREIEFFGRPLIVETGKLATQANGAVTVQYGDTMILATAVMSKTIREGIDFFPLTVDYEERMYAGGKIPGGYPRRETRPRDEAVLMGRLTDRPLRPLFPKGMRNDVQVVITTLSYDQENDPGPLGILGASLRPDHLGHPLERPRRGRAHGVRRRRSWWSTRPSRPAREERPRPDHRRHVGRGDDGRGGGEAGRRAPRPGRHPGGPRGDPHPDPAPGGPAPGVRQAEVGVHPGPDRPGGRGGGRRRAGRAPERRAQPGGQGGLGGRPWTP